MLHVQRGLLSKMKDDFVEVTIKSIDGWTCLFKCHKDTVDQMKAKLSMQPALVINNYAKKVQEMLDANE